MGHQTSRTQVLWECKPRLPTYFCPILPRSTFFTLQTPIYTPRSIPRVPMYGGRKANPNLFTLPSQPQPDLSPMPASARLLGVDLWPYSTTTQVSPKPLRWKSESPYRAEGWVEVCWLRGARNFAGLRGKPGMSPPPLCKAAAFSFATAMKLSKLDTVLLTKQPESLHTRLLPANGKK